MQTRIAVGKSKRGAAGNDLRRQVEALADKLVDCFLSGEPTGMPKVVAVAVVMAVAGIPDADIVETVGVSLPSSPPGAPA